MVQRNLPYARGQKQNPRNARFFSMRFEINENRKDNRLIFTCFKTHEIQQKRRDRFQLSLFSSNQGLKTEMILVAILYILCAIIRVGK